MDIKNYFKGKKITVMGLGLLGRGIGVAKFLAECGADLIVTDLKTEKQLAPSLEILKNDLSKEVYSKINFVLGEHRLEDFRNRDLVLKIADVPLNSPYVAEALESGAEVTKDAALFCKLRPDVITIGITGTRGKSTTTQLIYEILSVAIKSDKSLIGKNVFLAGNVRGLSTLPLLTQAKAGDIVVMELDSWQLQGFSDSKVSPRIAVFTNLMPDHLKYYGGELSKPETMKKAMDLYYEDKAQIFRFQKPDDVLVLGEKIAEMTVEKGEKINGKKLVAKVANLPAGWTLGLIGEHNKANIACAVLVARELGVDENIIRSVAEGFIGVTGRLEYLGERNGVRIYNDNSSTTPDATIAGLRAVGTKGKRYVVLIVGGFDKNLDMSFLIKEIPLWCSKVVLFKESGTDRIRDDIFALKKLGVEIYEEEGMENTVKRALVVATPGDTILYSPAFSSFGKYFVNEYDRGDQFVKMFKDLK